MLSQWCPRILLGVALASVVSLAAASSFPPHILYAERTTLSHAAIEDAHFRTRRAAAAGAVVPLEFSFTSFNRSFALHLVPHATLFGDAARFTVHRANASSHIAYDTSRFYKGHTLSPETRQPQEGAVAYGRVRVGGRFDGAVHVDGQIYYVEPEEAQDTTTHLVYRASDVSRESVANARCGAADAATSDDTFNAFPHPRHDVLSFASNLERRAVSCNSNVNAAASYCSLALVADATFYAKYGTEAGAIDKMISLVQGAEAIYQATAFGNGAPPVGFYVVHVTVFTDASTSPGDAIPLGTDVTTTLQNFAIYGASNEFNDVCLGHLFVDRDFSGVLGLAYVGSTSSLGGVCQNRATLSYGSANTNTGLTSVRNGGSSIPHSLSVLTVTHEIGHNFGSPHDSTAECTPSAASGGKYVMYSFATSGNEPNNDVFSDCSIESICEVLNARATCFTANPGQVCGNTVTESPESCDCGVPVGGSASTCSSFDACCVPGCDLAVGAQCSPKADACCTSTGCAIASAGTECAPATECREAAVCSGSDKSCAEGTARANGTGCECGSANGGGLCPMVCAAGVCGVSQCVHSLGLQECTCDAGANACKLCCLSGGGVCQPFDELGGSSTVWRAPSETCSGSNDRTGYCSDSTTAPTCNVPNSQELLDSLVSFLSAVTDWIQDNWWWVLLAVLGIILGIVLLRFFCRQRDERREYEKRRRRALKRHRKRGHHVPDEALAESIPMTNVRPFSASSTMSASQTPVILSPKSTRTASRSRASMSSLSKAFPLLPKETLEQALIAADGNANAAYQDLVSSGFSPSMEIRV